jgi:predicted RNA polymerase sigma factor
VRAHLLELAGETEDAIQHYRRAARLTTSLPEQRFLTAQAARLRAAMASAKQKRASDSRS